MLITSCQFPLSMESEGLRLEDGVVYFPVVQYKKEEVTVTLCGICHIAEKSYYEELQSILDSQEIAYIERLRPSEDEDSVPEEKKKYLDFKELCPDAYRRRAYALGLEYEFDVLEERENWQFPDMTLVEFILLTPVKVLDELREWWIESELEKTISTDPAFRRELKRLMYTSAVEVLQSDPKNPTEGYEKEVISKRNKWLFESLGEGFESYRTIGIVYGMHHLPGIDAFLTEQGFEMEDVLLLRAMDINE